MGSETTYFTIDDDGNNQILGYSNLMSMGVEEDHLEEGDGGEGGEDLLGEGEGGEGCLAKEGCEEAMVTSVSQQ